LGCGVTYKTENKKKKNIYKDTGATYGSNKELLQKMPIYRATKNFISLQILQRVSVVWKCFKNLEGTDPKGFKLTMLALVLYGCIPFKY
jgi:hypothetical protein